jgi:hypothetical protein
MDLLFKRYASPFLFIDGMIRTGRFCSFVEEFCETIMKEKEEQTNWEYFLHKVWEGSFKDFKANIENNRELQNLSKTIIETTVQKSMNILNNFNPERGDQ